MSRRTGIVGVSVVALLLGGLVVGRGLHAVSAAHNAEGNPAGAAERVASPTPESPAPAPVASASASEPATALNSEKVAGTYGAAARPAEQVDGISDVDPHKAFGSKSAPVVMEVFSDYQCPSCKAFYIGTNRQLMDNYVTTGKVYLIHRDFPLPIHAYSRIAARYARAAADLGKIEPVEKALYDNQEKWEQTGDVDGTLAAVVSAVDMNKIRTMVKAGTLEPLIDKDFQLGQMYRVNSTPTTVFHYKGQTYPYSGGMTWDTLRQFLDQLLSQK